MKRFIFAACALTLAAPLLAQDWKGMGRLMGKVEDPDGKAVPGATVKIACPKRGGGPTVTTDKKGNWSYQGLVACEWEIDVIVEGFQTKKQSISLPTENARPTPVVARLEKLKGPPPELVEALKKGDDAFKAENWEEARVNYEKLAAQLPDLAPQLNPRLARIYAGLKNPEKAIEFLQKTIDADPSNQQMKFVAAQTALDAKLDDKALLFLAAIDDAQVSNGDGYYDIAIGYLGKGDAVNATTYFTKSVAKDPKIKEAYYWRGISYVQQGKMAEAKADMQKALELDPGGTIGEKAKKALESLK